MMKRFFLLLLIFFSPCFAFDQKGLNEGLMAQHIEGELTFRGDEAPVLHVPPTFHAEEPPVVHAPPQPLSWWPINKFRLSYEMTTPDALKFLRSNRVVLIFRFKKVGREVSQYKVRVLPKEDTPLMARMGLGSFVVPSLPRSSANRTIDQLLDEKWTVQVDLQINQDLPENLFGEEPLFKWPHKRGFAESILAFRLVVNSRFYSDIYARSSPMAVRHRAFMKLEEAPDMRAIHDLIFED